VASARTRARDHRERRRKLKLILPNSPLHNRSVSKPKVRFYQGPEGIKAVLNPTDLPQQATAGHLVNARPL
jgi:hypothetical protein